jgi:hypothetical protein
MDIKAEVFRFLIISLTHASMTDSITMVNLTLEEKIRVERILKYKHKLNLAELHSCSFYFGTLSSKTEPSVCPSKDKQSLCIRYGRALGITVLSFSAHTCVRTF